MTNIDHDALEDLLRHASPRLAPSQEDEAVVREAVHAEWLELTGRRQARHRVLRYAIAATVLLGVFAGFNIFRAPVVEVVQVASIQKSIGPVYLLAEEAVLHETSDLSNIMSGQTIVTGDDAGLALAWGNGGSIRIDENSRVEFTDDESVFLAKGKIYFDSLPSSLVARAVAGDAPVFTLRTDLGDIRHVGTQYMTEVGPDTLIVSVREGEVAIDGKFHEQNVLSGNKATMAGRQRPSTLNISRFGEAWSWVNRITPPIDADGVSDYEVLTWACREIGLEPDFTDSAEAVARRSRAFGTIKAEPADTLRARLLTANMDGKIEEGVIHISYDP